MTRFGIIHFVATSFLLLSVVFFFQLVTDKYGSRYLHVMIWLIIAYVPILVIGKRTKDDDNFIRKLLLVYVCLIFLIFFSQPFFTAAFGQNFLDVIWYTLVIILPFQLLIYWFSTQDSDLALKQEYIKQFTHEERDVLVNLLGEGSIQEFFMEIDTILAEPESLSNDFSKKLIVLKAHWSKLQLDEKLSLLSSAELKVQRSQLVSALVDLVLNNTIHTPND